jgi:hypothetical protein
MHMSILLYAQNLQLETTVSASSSQIHRLAFFALSFNVRSRYQNLDVQTFCSSSADEKRDSRRSMFVSVSKNEMIELLCFFAFAFLKS